MVHVCVVHLALPCPISPTRFECFKLKVRFVRMFQSNHIYLHFWLICMVNVGKYIIHGWHGLWWFQIVSSLLKQRIAEQSHKTSVLAAQSRGIVHILRSSLLKKHHTAPLLKVFLIICTLTFLHVVKSGTEFVRYCEFLPSVCLRFKTICLDPYQVQWSHNPYR